MTTFYADNVCFQRICGFIFVLHQSCLTVSNCLLNKGFVLVDSFYSSHVLNIVSIKRKLTPNSTLSAEF